MKNGGRYASLILGAGALLFLAEHGVSTIVNPFKNGDNGGQIEYLVEDTIDRGVWDQLISRNDVVFCVIWFFITGGVNATLPADFNINSNSVNVIGNGAPGGPGLGGGGGSSCPPSPPCPPPCGGGC
jgi:hypothetical protein